MNVALAIRSNVTKTRRALIETQVKEMAARGLTRIAIRHQLGISDYAIQCILGPTPGRAPRHDRRPVPEGTPMEYRQSYLRNVRRSGEAAAQKKLETWFKKNHPDRKVPSPVTSTASPQQTYLVPPPREDYDEISAEWAPARLKEGSRSGGRVIEPGMVIYGTSDLLRVAARAVGIPVAGIKNGKRNSLNVQARHIAMYLLRRYTRLSMPQIARMVGRSDHTTAKHGIDRVQALVDRATIHVGEDPVRVADQLAQLDWTHRRSR